MVFPLAETCVHQSLCLANFGVIMRLAKSSLISVTVTSKERRVWDRILIACPNFGLRSLARFRLFSLILYGYCNGARSCSITQYFAYFCSIFLGERSRFSFFISLNPVLSRVRAVNGDVKATCPSLEDSPTIDCVVYSVHWFAIVCVHVFLVIDTMRLFLYVCILWMCLMIRHTMRQPRVSVCMT